MRQAAVEIRSLRAQVERLFNDGIHTCHDQCPRFGCVQRREIESLRAQVAQERAGIVRWLRTRHESNASYAHIFADAIEAQQDKEPT